MKEAKAAAFVLIIAVFLIIRGAISDQKSKQNNKKLPIVCYVDQQVIEEPFCFPKSRTYRIITSLYIEKDSCKITLNTWEDITSEETLQKKKEDRLNQANDLRFETNMGIITGKINICK